MACFCCNTTENLIFLFIYLQRKADLSTSEKSLVFVTIQHNTYTIRPAIIYESFTFKQKYAFAERCCFLTFSFKGKLRKYDISVKRKHTKTNENIIFAALFTNFCETKILFLCSETTAKSLESQAQTSDNMLATSANLIPKVSREISYPGDTTLAKQQLGAKSTDTKILGIHWNENEDTLSVEIPKSKGKHTKHNIVRHLVSVYDF